VTPTAVAQYTGIPPAGARPQLLTWDVTADLDDRADYERFEGWEIRDEDAAPGAGGQSVLTATEASDNRPQLAIVYSVREAPGCVDVLPRFSQRNSQEEALLRVLATDGAEVSAGAVAACNGAPAPSERVNLTISDDAPDVYVSSIDGVQTTGAANTAVARLDAAGQGSAGLRMATPSAQASGDAGEAGVVASRPCEVVPCPAPADDEATVRWSWAPPGTPATPGAELPGAVDPFTIGSAPPPSAPGHRTLLALTRRTIGWRRTAAITGRIDTADPHCAAGQRVQLSRRTPAGGWERVLRTTTSASGRFRFETVVSRHADYELVAAATATCDAATSGAFAISAVARMTLVGSYRRGTRPRIRLIGHVLPRRPGSPVVIERRTAAGWKTVAGTILDGRSHYRVALRPSWTGRRTFRARWPGGRQALGPAYSRTVTITVPR
jgi:hypothetical protein